MKKPKVDLTGRRFGKLLVIGLAETKIDNNFAWKCLCSCGKQVVKAGNALQGGYIKSCGHVVSYGECLIADILTKNNISFKQQYTFDDLRGPNNGKLKFDFAILSDNQLVCLIEYQGVQHFENRSQFGQEQRNITDKKKKEYCKKHNIKLYEIRYDQDIEVEIKKIISNKELTCEKNM